MIQLIHTRWRYRNIIYLHPVTLCAGPGPIYIQVYILNIRLSFRLARDYCFGGDIEFQVFQKYKQFRGKKFWKR